jgi:hypothetical protein
MNKPYVYTGFSEKSAAKLSRLFTKLQKDASPEIPKVRFETIQRLVGKKRNIVGSGFYAITFEYGATQVLKTNIAAIDIEDDAQPDWLHWCSQNQNLDWVPRIDYLYIDWKRNEYLAIMEKLNSVDDVVRRAANKKLASYEIEFYSELIPEYLMIDKKKRVDVAGEAFIQKEKFKLKHGVDLPFYETFFKGKGDEIRNELWKNREDYYIDMHTDNFMIRNSGLKQAIVITDPITHH